MGANTGKHAWWVTAVTLVEIALAYLLLRSGGWFGLGVLATLLPL